MSPSLHVSPIYTEATAVPGLYKPRQFDGDGITLLSSKYHAFDCVHPCCFRILCQRGGRDTRGRESSMTS